MQFNSSIFIFLFLPLVVAIHGLIKNTKLRNWWLLIVGALFYGWCNIQGLYFLIVYGIFNYLFVKLISHSSKSKIWMVIGICADVLILFVFKYLGFAAETINILSGIAIEVPNLFQPMGISFVTFTMIAYLADLYKGTAHPVNNIFDFYLYLSFFAKAGQGPIVRHDQMLPEIEGRTCSHANFFDGLERFVFGFAKKVLIADFLGKTVDAIFAVPGLEITTATAWMGMLFYTFQIYYDFSGYTDMAIGVGRMLGFKLPENFDNPYFSKSVSEFWNRWHITLGRWFKDYIYIPLGGNRKGKARQIFNLSVVWFVTGLWHGAAFHYILWGVYYGFFVILEKQIDKKQWYLNTPSWIKWSVTFFLTVIGWTIFRSGNVTEMMQYFGAMLGKVDATACLYQFAYFFDISALIAFSMAVVCALPKPNALVHWVNNKKLGQVVKTFGLVLLFAMSVVFMVNSTYNSFIYFQF